MLWKTLMLYTKLDGDVPDWELIFYVGIVSNWNCQKRKSAIIKNAKAGTIMDNAYSYDAVSDVLGIQNNAPLPQSGKAGGQMSHSYTYDPLYRLASATGTYAGANSKTASYTLAMGYDNMHRITSKKQHLTQTGVQFDGTLNAGYDLTYTYQDSTGHKFQLANVRDINYRTEETPTDSTNINNGHKYIYDANGNLVYINTSRVKRDGKEDEKATEQKYRWDEENRLLAADENYSIKREQSQICLSYAERENNRPKVNGFVSNYWYDADGERTVKTSGENEAIYVNYRASRVQCQVCLSIAEAQPIITESNSEFSGGNTGTARFSLYVSPYLVAGQGGKYTKHIYIGSQRIVSKLGDLASYGADPRRIPYAGNEADGLTINYKDKYNQQLQSIKDNYKTFDLPYNGKDNDDYVNGQGFCCNDGTPEAAQARAMARTRAANGNFKPNDDYEKMQFFYHPDHLGSSNYITNLDGEVSQHIEYVPFGEVFIEERNNTWNTPYLFNAKEFDEETGMYYYGARYYEPRLSLWMSADPLAEEYIDISAYTYCHNNPINLFDPDGQGDYYTDAGKWLGSDGKQDNMAYTATGVRKEKNKNGSLVNVFEHPVKLSIGQKELNTLASTVYAESSIGYGIFSKEEMFAIASVHVNKNKVAYGKDSPSAKAFRRTTLSKQTNAMQTANAAVINAFTPGSIDYSNGADQWDGAEQAMIPKEFQNKPSNGTFMYKMNVMGWSMRDKEYASWKNAVNKKFGNGSFNVPQKKTAGYNYGGMKNKGRIRLTPTAQYGLTIFWRTIK